MNKGCKKLKNYFSLSFLDIGKFNNTPMSILIWGFGHWQTKNALTSKKYKKNSKNMFFSEHYHDFEPCNVQKWYDFGCWRNKTHFNIQSKNKAIEQFTPPYYPIDINICKSFLKALIIYLSITYSAILREPLTTFYFFLTGIHSSQNTPLLPFSK